MLKRIIFEDDHLLVANKPAGLNTHAPAPHAGEGLFDWLRQHERRWAKLAIIHRLDKETSGVIVFGKTPEANRSLTQQFSEHQIRKKYVLLTDRRMKKNPQTMTSAIVRLGEKYVSRPLHPGGDKGVTKFKELGEENGLWRIEAEPMTGRTHQIRVHASSQGFPILGDGLYGGKTAARLCLHARSLSLTHPVSGKEVVFEIEPDFNARVPQSIREMVIDPDETDSYRVIHGASDGWPGWYLDQFGPVQLSQSEHPLNLDQKFCLEELGAKNGSVYHKWLDRHVRKTRPTDASPQKIMGSDAPDRFTIRENGVQYELSLAEGYSVGIFLDQRSNRRRLLNNYIAPGFPILPEGVNGQHLLNTFAYTCAFSVCAAKAGMKVTSLDLSRKYLEWGERNFALNGIDPKAHDFIFGDAFDWMKRLSKKQRFFDVIILDPPTFSQSKESGVFQAEKDYGALVSAALLLLKPQGVLLCSTNAARLAPADFLDIIQQSVHSADRKILQQHYAPQPPDFPISREEPGYLKTVWSRIR